MASSRAHQILVSEAIFVAIFWIVAFVAPCALSLKLRETLTQVAYHAPLDMSMFISGFILWFEVYTMNFHRGLLRSLDLESTWFSSLNIPLYIPTAVHYLFWCFFGYQDAPMAWEQLQHSWQCQFIYRFEALGSMPRFYSEIQKHDNSPLPYKYSALSHSRAIRILTLQSSESDSSPLVGTVKEEVLDTCSSFHALSYAWDDEDGDAQILCDGALLRVSKNCAAALRRIRLHKGATQIRLWVDAICIDQHATLEKERQLAIMGEIYKKAANVIVWLGEHDESSTQVLEFFAVVAESYDKERMRSKTTEQALRKLRNWRLMGEGLTQFFNRSWFTRMWPIQEVTLPSRGRVTILCGSTELPFQHLRFGWDVLKDLGLLPASVNLDQSVALQFYLTDALALTRGQDEESSNAFRSPLITDMSQFSLSGVMNATRFKACKYPKDKFFALYGVFQELGISFNITPDMYHSHTDAEIMKLVMISCLSYDGNLDSMRLCQLADPYRPSTEFIRTRQDPYDSFSTAVIGMTRRLIRVFHNVFNGEALDYVPRTEWRTALPSWAPDWTQWTRTSLDPKRDIRFLPSYSSIFVQTSHAEPSNAGTGSMDLLRAQAQDAASTVSSSQPESPTASAHYTISGSKFLTEAQFHGRITDIGSVDSLSVLWQVFTPAINSLRWSTWSFNQLRQNLVNSKPDPALAALVETMINFLWRSRMAQVFESLRMAVRTLYFVDIIAYIVAVIGAGWTGPWTKELICMRYPSIASCPTDGFAMRKNSNWGSYAETQLISTMFNNFLNGGKPWNTHMWYDLTGTALATMSYLLWDCRVSISESLFGGKYDEIDWRVLAPLYLYIMAAFVQSAAGLIGDMVFILLAQAAIALSAIWASFVLFIWARRVSIPLLIIFGMRVCYNLSWKRLHDIFESQSFRPADVYTPGMHFFVTEEGLTGNTHGPVQENDLLVIVKDCCDHLILRQKGDGFVVIGSAYIGYKALETVAYSQACWRAVVLY